MSDASQLEMSFLLVLTGDLQETLKRCERINAAARLIRTACNEEMEKACEALERQVTAGVWHDRKMKRGEKVKNKGQCF